jgi:hypothetical protein
MLWRECLGAHPALASCLRLHTSRQALSFSVRKRVYHDWGKGTRGYAILRRKGRPSRGYPGKAQNPRLWQGKDQAGNPGQHGELRGHRPDGEDPGQAQ